MGYLDASLKKNVITTNEDIAFVKQNQHTTDVHEVSAGRKTPINQKRLSIQSYIRSLMFWIFIFFFNSKKIKIKRLTEMQKLFSIFPNKNKSKRTPVFSKKITHQ